MADNVLTVVGNLTRDPETKFSASGTAVTRLGVAVNRRTKNKSTDEWEDNVSFFNAVAFGDLAEHIADSVFKGNRVVITGRLEQRTWETDEGEKRSVVEIVCDEVAPSLRWATADVKRVEKAAVGGTRPPVQDEEPF